jgi:hypothetical protein
MDVGANKAKAASQRFSPSERARNRLGTMVCSELSLRFTSINRGTPCGPKVSKSMKNKGNTIR